MGVESLPNKSVANGLEEFTILIYLGCFLMLSDTEKNEKEWIQIASFENHLYD